MNIPKITLQEAHKLFDEGKLVGLFLMPNEHYHACPGVSKSSLDNIRESPEYFVYKQNNPDELTTPLIIGTHYHNELTKDEPFEALFYVTKTQPMKPERDEMARMPISQANKDLGERMVAAFLSDPINKMLVTDAVFEVCSFWVDQESGVLCKSKEDCFIPSKGIIVDFKSIADLNKIKWAQRDYRHHVKAAFALDGMGEAIRQSGKDYGFKAPDKFCFTYQEKSEPFRVRRRTFKPNSLVLGEKEYREDLATYFRCLTTENWKDQSTLFDEDEVPGALGEWA